MMNEDDELDLICSILTENISDAVELNTENIDDSNKAKVSAKETVVESKTEKVTSKNIANENNVIVLSSDNEGEGNEDDANTRNSETKTLKRSNSLNSAWKNIFKSDLINRAVSAVKRSKTISVSGASKSPPSFDTDNQRKVVPQYKKIPNTNFTVDAFNYGIIPGCTAYFLSHFHADHYMGLNKSFSGILYCSSVTANLVVQELGVAREQIVILPMESEVLVESVSVTCIDANHCPGSVMFIFQHPNNGDRYLHCGDCRASESLIMHPKLHVKPFKTVYLDTTYCNSAYSFPPQEVVISRVADWIADEVDRVSPDVQIAIVVGTYKIGKERIALGIAKAIESDIFVTRQKRKVYDLLEFPEFQTKLSSDPKSARVHLIPMGNFSGAKLSEYLDELQPKFTHLIAVQPTGWKSDSDTNSEDFVLKPVTYKYIGDKLTASNSLEIPRIRVLNVPYSEHSSCAELERFVRYVKAEKWHPTVTGRNNDWRKIFETVKNWNSMRKER